MKTSKVVAITTIPFKIIYNNCPIDQIILFTMKVPRNNNNNNRSFFKKLLKLVSIQICWLEKTWSVHLLLTMLIHQRIKTIVSSIMVV